MLRSKFIQQESISFQPSARFDEWNKLPEDGRRNGLDEDGLYGSRGFFFQQRTLPLNLRLLSQMDIDRVVKDIDIECLQNYIEQVAFCSLREEELRYVTDQQVLKLFRLAQLIIEYLLYSQDKLIDNVSSMAKKYGAKKKYLKFDQILLQELNRF